MFNLKKMKYNNPKINLKTEKGKKKLKKCLMIKTNIEI